MSVSDLNTCIYAYEGKLEELIQYLLKNPEFVNKRDSNERAPIHWACSSGNTEIAQMLVSRGAEINERDDSGNWYNWKPVNSA